MKKFLSLVFSSALALQLAACGGSDSGGKSTPPPPPAPAPNPTPAPNPNPTPNPTPSADITLPTAVKDAVAQAALPGNYAGTNGYGYGTKAISYDAATQTYTFYTGGSTNLAFALAKDKAVTGPVAGYNYFNASDPAVAGSNAVVAVYNNSSGPINFTYTSFAFARDVNSNLGATQTYARVYGAPTSSLPRTGTATYTGIVGGNAVGNGAVYALTGSSTLNADFGNGKYSTSLSFTGVNVNGGAGLPSQTYTGNTTGFVLNGSPFNGDLQGSGTGTWGGKFFGPDAEEFGYTFRVSGNGYTASGVAAGKKN